MKISKVILTLSLSFSVLLPLTALGSHQDDGNIVSSMNKTAQTCAIVSAGLMALRPLLLSQSDNPSYATLWILGKPSTISAHTVGYGILSLWAHYKAYQTESEKSKKEAAWNRFKEAATTLGICTTAFTAGVALEYIVSYFFYSRNYYGWWPRNGILNHTRNILLTASTRI